MAVFKSSAERTQVLQMLVFSKLVCRGKPGNREMFLSRPHQIPLYLLFFRRWSKACMLLTCILGLTWLFGVFYINQDSLFMAYCFTIFNTLQVTCYQLLFIVLQSLLTPVKLLSCSYQSKTVQPSETPSLLTQLTIPHWKIIYFQDWKYQTTLPNMKYYLSITCVQSVSVKRRHLSLSYFFISGFIYIFIPLHWRREGEYQVALVLTVFCLLCQHSNILKHY